MIPSQYQAKDIHGNLVNGYFVMLHCPIFNEHGTNVVGFKDVPSIFNDSEGERSNGSYWHEIDIATLKPIINKPIQLNLFEQ